MGHTFQVLPGTFNQGPHNKEKYFLEIRNRYRWLLDMGGERVLLLKKRFEGQRCPLFDKVRMQSQQQHSDNVCMGTGFISPNAASTGPTAGAPYFGYFAPIEIVVSLMTGGPEEVVVEDYGRRRIYKPRSWTLWEPIISVGDILVRRNNQRLWVTAVYARRWKHFITRQDIETAEVERDNPVYQIPSGL